MNGGFQPSVSHETRWCHCGRAECRPNQRNCRHCHKEANEIHRLRKAQRAAALKDELHNARLKIISLQAREAS